jgi:hypothetical protein
LTPDEGRSTKKVAKHQRPRQPDNWAIAAPTTIAIVPLRNSFAKMLLKWLPLRLRCLALVNGGFGRSSEKQKLRGT